MCADHKFQDGNNDIPEDVQEAILQESYRVFDAINKALLQDGGGNFNYVRFCGTFSGVSSFLAQLCGDLFDLDGESREEFASDIHRTISKHTGQQVVSEHFEIAPSELPDPSDDSGTIFFRNN